MRRGAALFWLALGLWAALFAATARAGDGRRQVAVARQAYAAGEYAGAQQAFAAAVQADPALATVGLCLDAATAARLAGEPGRAAVWLYRATLRAPQDAQVRKAMAAAGLDAGTLFTGAWTPLGWLAARQWWAVALVANAVFWLALAGARLAARPVPRRVALGAGALVLCCWLGAGWVALAPRAWPRGVVLGETPAQSAPEAGAEAVGRFAPGTLARLGPERGGHTLAVAVGGLAGWVSRDAVVTLVP